jgi:hypothetical protein
VNPHDRKYLYDLEVDALLAEAVTVNPDFIESDLARNASDLAYFGECHADRVLDHGNAEINLRTEEAKLNITHRERLIAMAEPDSKGNRKAPTVDAVKAAVEADPQFIALSRMVLEAEVAMVRAKSRMEAVRAKKDAIIQIAMTRRAEMGIDPSIAAEHRSKVEAQRIYGQSK